MKQHKLLWICTNLHTREIPKVRGKYLTREAVLCPHADTLPKDFPQRNGFQWSECIETIVDPKLKAGEVVFRQLDYQVARISRFIGK